MHVLNVPEADREPRRSDAMTSIFGRNGQRVLALITGIPVLSADQVDQVTGTWKQGNPDDRASAWAQLNGTTSEEERYEILAAASLARREALETSRRMRRDDRAFWAAACDASAAVAAGDRIGRPLRHPGRPVRGGHARPGRLTAEPRPCAFQQGEYNRPRSGFICRL